MIDRDKALLEMRPELDKAKTLPGTSAGEKFQNEVLRPVAKLQNDLFIQVFKDYIVRRKNVFHSLSNADKMSYITYAIDNDSKLKKFMRGLFVGMFTLDELAYYQENSSKMNRRMHNLIRERLQSQLQIFEP